MTETNNLTKSPKQAVLKVLEHLPDDASFEDIMYEVYVLEGIERGLADVAAGRTIPHEEVMKNINEWLGLAGQ